MKRCQGKKRARPTRATETEDEEEEDMDVKCLGTQVFFYADVSTRSVLLLLEKMTEAFQNAAKMATPFSDTCVYVYIHSGGGDAYAGLSAMQHLQTFPCKVVTIMDGFCASAASLIFLGGAERIAYRHAYLLIHQLQTTFCGRYEELQDEVKNSTLLMDTFRNVYQSGTRISAKALESLLRDEKCISAEECLKHGFATRIV